MTGCIMAIDPGLTGALSFYDPAFPDRIAIEDMPVVGHEVNAAELLRSIRLMAPAVAIVEGVGPMPKDGPIQAWRFGAAFSAAKVALTASGVSYHLVTPAKWKRSLALIGGPEGKEQARALALRMFPASASSFSRKKDHNRAEAALLARYCAEHFPLPSTGAAT